MERVVVVGAGLAGLRAAEQIRKGGFGGELTIVGDEPHRPYERPPLSKQLLAGDQEHEDGTFDCEKLDASWVLSNGAKHLDAQSKRVTLADGEELPYDGLVIATGRRSREWPELPELEGFHMLRSVDDALALREAAASEPRVVIVGAGFIGCEVAATLRGRGLSEVTLVEMADQPMPPLGVEAGRRAADAHERNGVGLRLESSVEGFEGNGRVEAVRLAGGERLDADLVLLAIGSAPNSEWLEGSGIELRDGCVLCDSHCFAAGVDGVVAAGDVAAWPHPHSSAPVWVEHFNHANEMGRAAGAALMAAPGERSPFAPIPTFWSDQFDMKIKSVGLFGQATATEVVEEDDEGRMVIEGRRGEDLMGAVIFNKNRAFADYRRRLAETLDEPAA